MSGSIKFSGATPSAFKGNSSGRTAFPTAPTSLVYKIKATSGSSVIEFSSSEASSGGSITVAGDTITFTISLTSGTWALTASAEDSSGKKVLATKNAVSIPLTGDSPSVSLGDPLVLNYASSSSTGKGSIGLTLSCASSTNIQSIKVNPLTSGISTATSNTTSDWLWSQSNVNPGSYKVEFLFYSGTDCSGTILYRINEVVNIYSNLTTDTFEDASYVSSGHIEITGSLLASAELVTIYVSSSGSDSGTGSYFSPVKTLKQAVNLVNNSSAAATTEFEILVRDNISLGGSATLNSGKKASITSEGSSAVTVSGGSSHDSLTISGEAEVSNLNFSGLGGINVNLSSSKLTINDSTVENGTASVGGGFYVGSGAELVSEQGLVIKNCSATGSYGFGGGIYNAGTVSLTACEISSCTAAVSGSSIYNSAAGSLTLGGETSIDGSIYLQSNAHPLELGSDFSSADTIAIELYTLTLGFTFGDTVISSATATQAACFTTPDGSDYSLEFVAASGKVIMNSAARFIIYVGGTGASDETGDGSNSNPYATLEKSLEVAAERYAIDNGEYSIYVKDTITLTRNIEITGLPDLTLAGNVAATSTSTETINGDGYNIKFSCNATVRNLEFYGLGASSTFVGPITIASGTEVEAEHVKVTSCTNTGGDGGGIYNAGTLTLKNCTVSGCEAKYIDLGNQGFGGGIYSQNSSSLTLENTTVSGNKATLGGGIFIGGSCNAQITDSTIQSNSAESTVLGTFGGGGIFVNDGGSLTLSGDDSKIILNTAKSSTSGKIPHGGGILCRGSMTMESGTISQNEVIADFEDGYGYGGGVALEPTSTTSTGTFTMSGGSISGNEATFGGGIANRGLNLVLSGGTIGDINGNTASYGGGVYVGAFNFGTDALPNLKQATCTISGCTIERNTASAYGGGIFSEDSSITFNAGSVEFNKVESSSIDYIGGGGIYIKQGTLNFGGTGKIKSNSAQTSTISAAGGGLYIYVGGIVNMDGGSIEANSAKSPSGDTGCAQGGGVYISGSGKMTLSDGTISDNNTYSTTTGGSSMGGGVFVYTGGEMTMTGGSIKDNGYTASTILGGGIYSFGSLTLTSGTITSNDANSGGGIYLNVITPGTSSLNYGTTLITGNNASALSNNFYISTGVKITGTILGITYTSFTVVAPLQG
ncbi:MAG: right-handed parallel beta-helix repeat-containing protein [Treponema sp.]|nr:right-handed parallel beta-helix repeat-containing protein [Treponema sp.]